jgi:hypothetical protein
MAKAVLIGESSGATMDRVMAVYPRHKFRFADAHERPRGRPTARM